MAWHWQHWQMLALHGMAMPGTQANGMAWQRVPPMPRHPCPPAAGHIFAAQLLPASQATGKGLRQGSVLDAGGSRRISKAEAAEAAVAAYRHALRAVEQLSSRPGLAIDPAAKRQVVCRLQQEACAVLQAQQAPALAQCLAELQQAGCAPEGGSGSGGSAQPHDQNQPAGGREEL